MQKNRAPIDMRILQMTLDAMKINYIRITRLNSQSFDICERKSFKKYQDIFDTFFLNCMTCNSDKKQNELNSFKQMSTSGGMIEYLLTWFSCCTFPLTQKNLHLIDKVIDQ